jgi:RecA/RadA recombinase
MTQSRQGALDIALGQIERQYGKGAIMRLGETEQALTTESLPTGCLSLDIALGIGGVPRARVTEIYGAEAAGKSTIAMHIMAESQKLGGTAAYIDVEHAMDPSYAARLGLNIQDLLISQPDNAEQALEITEYLVRSGAIDVIIIDSVAALVPKAEIEGDGRCPRRSPSKTNVSSSKKANLGNTQIQNCRYFYQPNTNESGCNVWKPRGYTGRASVKILQFSPYRPSSGRLHQVWNRNHWQ